MKSRGESKSLRDRVKDFMDLDIQLINAPEEVFPRLAAIFCVSMFVFVILLFAMPTSYYPGKGEINSFSGLSVFGNNSFYDVWQQFLKVKIIDLMLFSMISVFYKELVEPFMQSGPAINTIVITIYVISCYAAFYFFFTAKYVYINSNHILKSFRLCTIIFSVILFLEILFFRKFSQLLGNYFAIFFMATLKEMYASKEKIHLFISEYVRREEIGVYRWNSRKMFNDFKMTFASFFIAPFLKWDRAIEAREHPVSSWNPQVIRDISPEDETPGEPECVRTW